VKAQTGGGSLRRPEGGGWPETHIGRSLRKRQNRSGHSPLAHGYLACRPGGREEDGGKVENVAGEGGLERGERRRGHQKIATLTFISKKKLLSLLQN